MKIGSLDTDSKALQSRIDLQNEYSSFDLNTWIFDCLDINDEHACLDLGCGTGNQILKITSNPNFSGHITGMDVSEDSLASLMFSAKDQGVADKVTTIKSELDDVPSFIEDQLFDRIYSSYALYYVRNAELLIKSVSNSLLEGGKFFYCGPTKNNNLELRNLISEVTGNTTVLDDTVASKFMEEEGIEISKKFFSKVEIFNFTNIVSYPSAESLLEYFRSHNLYSLDYEADFCNRVDDHFKKNSEFINTKYGLGILASV